MPNRCRLSIVALGNDVNGNIYADTLSFGVQGTDTLKSLSVTPLPVTIDSSNRVISLTTTGLFTNGTDSIYRDITAGASGTAYSTQYGDSILSVTSNGVLTGNHAGFDTILVANQSIKAMVPVRVDSSLIRVVKFASNIDFAVSDKSITDPPFALDGTASSGEDVSYTLISGPVLLNNGVITITGAGTVTIKASSPGNAYFSAARDVTITFIISGSLPVTLINFTGSLNKGDARLQWQTAQETKSGYFNVERSTDGLHFTTICKVNAAGNSSRLLSYGYADAGVINLGFSVVYYRLAEVDKDGKINLSNIVPINIPAGSTTLTVSPNPVKDFIMVHSSINQPDANITIADVSGRVLYAAKQSLYAGNQQLIDVSTFAKGVYLVTIQSANNVKQFKVLKE